MVTESQTTIREQSNKMILKFIRDHILTLDEKRERDKKAKETFRKFIAKKGKRFNK